MLNQWFRRNPGLSVDGGPLTDNVVFVSDQRVHAHKRAADLQEPVSPSERPVPLRGQKRECIEKEYVETLAPLARRRELKIIDRRRSTSSGVVLENVVIRHELV